MTVIYEKQKGFTCLSLARFEGLCKDGRIEDTKGTGFFAVGLTRSNVKANVQFIKRNGISEATKRKFTHVHWLEEK